MRDTAALAAGTADRRTADDCGADPIDHGADLAFPSGGYTLTRAGRAKLDEIIPALQGLQNGKVVVFGYTDDRPVGKAAATMGIVDNLDLSSKRANEVIRYLETKGLDPYLLSAKGRGDTHPVAPNDTLEGWAQNRRIEVSVEQPEAPPILASRLFAGPTQYPPKHFVAYGS
jgi:flagellar motor protein MotB